MNKWAWLMVLLGVAGTVSVDDGEAGRQRKLKMVQEVADTFREVTALSARCVRHECDRQGDLDQSVIQNGVSRILAGHRDPQVLWRLAAICWTAGWPQTAGHQPVDLPFDFAWIEAVNLLAKSDSPEALDALVSLDSAIETDGGGAEQLSDAIAMQRKRLKPNR